MKHERVMDNILAALAALMLIIVLASTAKASGNWTYGGFCGGTLRSSVAATQD